MSSLVPSQLLFKPRYLAERIWHQAVISESRGVGWSCLRGAFSIASRVYGWGARAHDRMYSSGVRQAIIARIPVVSVGNIALGGSGKTPFACRLAEMLSGQRNVALISRGYRAAAERLKRPLVASLGAGPLYSPAFMGDEAYLLASRVPEAICIVGHNRREAVSVAAELGADVAILDDGLQHRSLRCQLQVALLNASLPQSAWELFPRGALREPLSALRRADLIAIVTEGDTDTSQLEWQVHKVSSAPLLFLEQRVSGLFGQQGAVALELQGKKVALLAGIAQPERFQRVVESLGGKVVSLLAPGDHGLVTPTLLTRFAKEAQKGGATALLCTEKDWVKLPGLLDLPLPLLYLQTTMYFRRGEELLREHLQRAKILLTS